MTSRNAWQRLLRGYFPAEIGRRSLKLGCCSKFYCSTSRFLLEFAFSSWPDALTCLLLRARRHKREKIVQMGRLSEWRCAVGQTTSLWSWWERRMQKRQYCTWGTVFSPVPSEGRTAQGMAWIVKICRKNTPLTQNTCVCGAHFDGGKRQDTFPFLQDLCGLLLL